MSRFLKRPLKVLDFIYDFVGGFAGLGEFADESAIQPVHDVSRESELGAALGGVSRMGYTLVTATDVHVATGFIRTTADPYNAFDNLAIPRNKGSIWVCGAFGTCDDSTDFTSYAVSVTWPTFVGHSAGQEQLIAFGNDAIQDVVGAGLFSVGDLARSNIHASPFPLFVPQGGILNFASESDTAGTVTIRYGVVLWAGPSGARPPGFA